MRIYFSILFMSCVGLHFISAQGLSEIESFNDCSQNSWTIIQEASSQSTWSCATDFGEPIIRLRGSETNYSIWLVSELIAFGQSAMPFISFKYKNAIVNGDLELFFASDYTGGSTIQAIESATWSPVPISLYPIGDDNEISNAAYHPSIALDFLIGQSVHFAFRFTSTSGEFDMALDELQIRSDYYADIDMGIQLGDRCADLKSSLTTLLDDHRVIPYTDRSFDIWDSHFTTDLRLNDAGEQLIIWDMYSDNPAGPEAYEYIPGEDKDFGEDIDQEGLYYNREHSFPTSWWGGNRDTDQYSDIHFIIPADKIVNTTRSNFPYGETDDLIIETSNGSKLGFSSLEGFTLEVFEPIDEYKGDVARMHLYVATRYGPVAGAWQNVDSRGQRVLSGEEYSFFVDWYLDVLLKWHRQDPVSQKEIDRNNAVFSIQGNRNPYIDHPEYADLIWGNEDGITCDMVTDVEDVIQPIKIDLSPNPVFNELVINGTNIDGIRIFDMSGRQVLEQEYRSVISLQHLEKGLYIIQLLFNEHGYALNQKIVKL